MWEKVEECAMETGIVDKTEVNHWLIQFLLFYLACFTSYIQMV